MFESEMQEHTRKHSQKRLYKCRVDPDCGKCYPAKRTRNAHEQTHSSEDWTCEATLEDGSLCGQECVSKNHLAQHIRGLHGPGWDSRCGKNFKWPSSKYKHEQECTTCKKIKSKEKKKPRLKGDWSPFSAYYFLVNISSTCGGRNILHFICINEHTRVFI